MALSRWIMGAVALPVVGIMGLAAIGSAIPKDPTRAPLPEVAPVPVEASPKSRPQPDASKQDELTGAAIEQIESMNSLTGGPPGMENATKAVLNLNGHLCADIVDVKARATAHNFEVTCIQSRSGSGKARYVVDGSSGTAAPF